MSFQLHTFNKGAYIMIEGKEATGFFIIKNGNVQINRDVVDFDDASPEAVLKAGDIFGVVSTMAKRSYTETAIAVSNAEVVSVKSDQFTELIEKNSNIALKIINTFSKRLRYLNDILSKVTLKQDASVVESTHLFDVGEYYANQNQYNQAYYAYYKYIKYCPTDSQVDEARQKMEKIKPYAKTAYLEEAESQDFLRNYPKDTMIFSEGEPGNECYIIQKGRVKISIIANNNEKVFVVLKTGDIFGEMALLENKPRSASATAVEDSILMAVNRGNFEKVVIDQPRMVCRLTELLSERIWSNYKQLSNTLIRDPVGKLYDALLTELEKNRIDSTMKKSFTFNFGPDSLIKLVGLDKSQGKAGLDKIFGEAKLEVKGDKLYAPDVTMIRKSADYYKKTEMRQRSIEANRGRY